MRPPWGTWLLLLLLLLGWLWVLHQTGLVGGKRLFFPEKRPAPTFPPVQPPSGWEQVPLERYIEEAQGKKRL